MTQAGYRILAVNPRLIRDAQVGLLWEGTSNINALDVIGRAVGKAGSHRALQAMLRARLADSPALPPPFRAALGEALDRAIALAERVAGQGPETLARQAATALYDASSAVLLAWEGARRGADARRGTGRPSGSDDGRLASACRLPRSQRCRYGERLPCCDR